MSLTSYRAAPPRVRVLDRHAARTSDGLDGRRDQPEALCPGGWWTWRRPTLPRLKTQYHWRGGFSRPSSGWDRVRAPRCDHQVGQPRNRQRRLSRISLSDLGTDRDAFVLLVRSLIGAVLPLRMASGGILGSICRSANAEIKPIERLVRLSFTRCRASTRLLSTGWSVPALRGVFVLRGVSRLDAFSGYPGRT